MALKVRLTTFLGCLNVNPGVLSAQASPDSCIFANNAGCVDLLKHRVVVSRIGFTVYTSLDKLQRVNTLVKYRVMNTYDTSVCSKCDTNVFAILHGKCASLKKVSCDILLPFQCGSFLAPWNAGKCCL